MSKSRIYGKSFSDSVLFGKNNERSYDKAHEFWEESWNKLDKEFDPMLDKLRNEFRKLFGIEVIKNTNHE